jgi:hypothetical protein
MQPRPQHLFAEGRPGRELGAYRLDDVWSLEGYLPACSGEFPAGRPVLVASVKGFV